MALLIGETMTRKVYQFVLPKFLGHPGDAGIWTLDGLKCSEAIDALTNVGQFGGRQK